MQPAKVLIVEDESIIALDLESSLTEAGFTIAGFANSAGEAIEKVAALQPDLVLMDIHLGRGGDGVEAAEQIQAQFHLPVVYLTAHADELTFQRAKQTEPFGYVLKPFDDRALVNAIEIALSRYSAEVAIRRALEKEREFNELKSHFVAVVSHEFRNPLNTILVASEILERYEDQIPREKRQTYLHRMQASARQMSYLLNEVLTLSELDTGKLQFNPVPIALGNFCRELVEEVELGNQRQHAIVLEEEWDMNSLHLDPPLSHSAAYLPCLDDKLLRLILSNLLTNAVKYSPNGSTVWFRLICSSHQAVFQIQDQGIGIPSHDHSALFGSFFRASNAKTTPGTGLGLSIVKQCVELHGGEISFESQVGVGTTFTVTLPLSGWQVADEEDLSH